MPTNGFSIKPLTVKLLAGEHKATKFRWFSKLGPRLGHVTTEPEPCREVVRLLPNSETGMLEMAAKARVRGMRGEGQPGMNWTRIGTGGMGQQ